MPITIVDRDERGKPTIHEWRRVADTSLPVDSTHVLGCDSSHSECVTFDEFASRGLPVVESVKENLSCISFAY